jgi:hypothetical protein
VKHEKLNSLPQLLFHCVIQYLLLFALELAPSKNSPIFCSGTFHPYLTEY